MAPTDANPACAPLKQTLGGWNELLGAWISDLGLGLEFWTLDKKSGPWIRILDLGEGIWIWVLGQVIWGLD